MAEWGPELGVVLAWPWWAAGPTASGVVLCLPVDGLCETKGFLEIEFCLVL